MSASPNNESCFSSELLSGISISACSAAPEDKEISSSSISGALSSSDSVIRNCFSSAALRSASIEPSLEPNRLLLRILLFPYALRKAPCFSNAESTRFFEILFETANFSSLSKYCSCLLPKLRFRITSLKAECIFSLKSEKAAEVSALSAASC